MDKKEQSFSFSDIPKQAVLNEDKHKVVSLSPAIKLTPTSEENLTAAEIAVQPEIKKGKPTETVNVIPLTGKIIDKTATGKIIKAAEISNKTKANPVIVAKVIKATGKATNSATIASNPTDNNTETTSTDAINAKKQFNTGATKKVPIPPSENVKIAIEKTQAKSEVKKQSAKKNIDAKKDIPQLDIKFGDILKSARQSKGLTLTEVGNKTKIGEAYIEALEAENLKDLPPIVYVYAYVKNLCHVYEINDEVKNNILVGLKKLLPTHLSQKTVHNLNIDYEIDKDEEHKLKLIITSSLAAIVIIAIVIAVAIWLMNSDNITTKQPLSVDKTIVFERSKLIELSPHQSIKMTILNNK